MENTETVSRFEQLVKIVLITAVLVACPLVLYYGFCWLQGSCGRW